MRKKVLVIISIIVLLVGIYVIMKNTQYKPSRAVAVARRFMKAMKSEQIKKAYALTDKKSRVGNSLKKFDKKITKEWRRHGGKLGHQLKVREIFPFQSYFNMLKRSVMGKKADMDIINVDFWAGKIPFAVQLRSDDKGNWSVVNFESHAL